jgi:hypothetical protein
MREAYHIRLNTCVNKLIPILTVEEHKEVTAEKAKVYREEHKEQKKVYRKEHKEIIAEQCKVYYDANKEAILEKRKKKITCECGAVIRINDMLRHCKSQKHQKYLNKL